MKRDNELQKPAHILVLARKKGKRHFKLKCMVLKNSKANSQCWNIKNFKHRSKKWDVLFKKWSNVMICVEAKWKKLIRFVIIFLWKVIYVYFYNQHRPLDLIPVVYDLIELIIEVSLWTKDYSTFDTHTQHARLLFNEYLFYLCNYTCSNVMYVCSTICGSNQKDFFFLFVCFWKWFVSPMFFKVFQVVFVWKTCFLSIFVTFSCVSSVTS